VVGAKVEGGRVLSIFGVLVSCRVDGKWVVSILVLGSIVVVEGSNVEDSDVEDSAVEGFSVSIVVVSIGILADVSCSKVVGMSVNKVLEGGSVKTSVTLVVSTGIVLVSTFRVTVELCSVDGCSVDGLLVLCFSVNGLLVLGCSVELCSVDGSCVFTFSVVIGCSVVNSVVTSGVVTFSVVIGRSVVNSVVTSGVVTFCVVIGRSVVN